MNKFEIQTKLQELPEALMNKLLALSHGTKVSDFSTSEQDDLQEKFGDDWPTILGVIDDRS